MDLIKKIIVSDNQDNLRIVNYLLTRKEEFQDIIITRNLLKKMIRQKAVYIDGKPAHTSDFVTKGQLIEFFDIPSKPGKIFQLEIPVVYEDEYLAVINKPAGIPVSGNTFKTIENALPKNLKPSSQRDALALFRPVHRLDSLTSGLLIIAKTRSARIALGEMLAAHKIIKIYQAIVVGNTADSGIIDLPIAGKKAITKYKRIGLVQSLKCGWVSLLELYLETGRTHQLRIHLSQSGYPILGDKLYSNPQNVYRGKGLFLCAKKISFIHPITKDPVSLEIELPNKFDNYLKREQERNNRLD